MTFLYGESRHRNVAQVPVRSATMPTLYPPSEVSWSKKDIKMSKELAFKHQEKSIKCGPSCTEDHVHHYDYDYTKTFKDPIVKRPGIDFIIDPKIKQELAKGIDPNLFEFGKKQTPINLSSQMEVLEDFQDKEFDYAYEKVEQNQKQLKFNETGDAFFFDIGKGRDQKSNPNKMTTATISLFDNHIPSATLVGAQFHFHAPSEHSIDGQLLDLEMHIVHFMEEKHDPWNCSCCVDTEKDRVENNKSQFGAGVLGFFFKVMPEEYFKEMTERYPQADVDWHDKFMFELVKAENERQAAGAPNEEGLDLTEFVNKINSNKRWTYQGSLTTAPCME